MIGKPIYEISNLQLGKQWDMNPTYRETYGDDCNFSNFETHPTWILVNSWTPEMYHLWPMAESFLEGIKMLGSLYLGFNPIYTAALN